MNIKDIVDKIPKEADINPAEYTVEDRLVDINSRYLRLIEKAVQIGSTEPISDSEVVSETFNVVPDSNVFERTIPNVPLFKVDFQPNGVGRFCKVHDDPKRSINGCLACGMKFFADEKRIWVEQGRVGVLRVTYVRGDIEVFDMTDYNDNNPPSPDWLPETFHDLLWLYPALRQARFYKTDRVTGILEEIAELQILFENHYGRNSVRNQKVETRDRNCWGSSNYR